MMNLFFGTGELIFKRLNHFVLKNALSFLVFICLMGSVAGAKAAADSVLLKDHVLALTGLPGHRNFADTAGLNKAARYIYDHLHRYSDSVAVQSYEVKQRKYHNIILSYGPKDAPRIIVGAHYDVCGDRPGADDNASGVAGLLELARLLHKADTKNWKHRIDLVAYTLEEPPVFATKGMGSAVHAAYLKENHVPVKGMVCLEMIGYYRDGKNTQHFPAGILKLFYGSRGNFITVVRKLKGGPFTRKFTRRFKQAHGVRTKVFKGPVWIEGIDFSDHRNYWDEGWEALMLTDTSFYRNNNYHEASDTPDTLDYGRMASVVDKLYKALERL
jgi:hypothetical protein